jgi:hypothetical protein
LFVSFPRRLALAFVSSLLALVSVATAQTYTTFDYVIPLNQVGPVDGATIGAQPGWVIGIEAGTRQTLELANFHGTSSQPIIFVNKDGRVRIGPGGKRGIKVTGSSHFQIRGDNDPAHKYGIEVFKSTGSTVEITELSTDFELCFMEIWGSTFAGIMAKTDPQAGGYATRGTFTQYNTIIHDNYLHDHPGEALYIGNSFWASGRNIDGTVYYPHDLVGVRIYNNLVDMSGREGIQVGSASSDCEVYNNVVLNSGLLNMMDQRGGVQLGEGTTGKFYHNLIVNAPGNGLILLGQGDRLIANNVIANIGVNAIFCDDRFDTEVPGAHVRIVNNTIINYGQNAYLLFNQYTVNEFKNNLITPVPSGYKLIETLFDGGDDSGATYTTSNNVADIVANLDLADPANLDYRILGTSPAVDAGTNLASVGVTDDFEGLARPFGSGYDVGAFEFGALSVHLGAENASVFGASDGSITVTPLGGTAPYTYAWADGPTTATRTGLPRGDYTVTVTDSASATVTRTIRLTEPNELRVVSTRVSPAFAGSADGTASVSIDGGTPSYTVTWSNSATGNSVTGLAAGFYGYTVTDANGDTATGTVFIRDGGTPVYRINNGGLELSDAHLNWAIDKQSSPSPYRVSGSNTTSGSDQNYNHPNPTEGPNNIFNPYRKDSAGGSEMSWEFPVTNGYYEVDLFFNGTVQGVGAQVFDVQLEGTTVLDDFDLYAINGNINKPTQRSFLVHITDGVIDLDFLHGAAGDPTVNGIAIYSFGSTLPTGFPLYRINNGGIAQTTPPLDWALDKQTTPSPYLYAGGGLTTGSNTWNSGGTNTTDAPDNIFGSRRYDPAYTTPEMQWRFPVEPGLYRVNLYFIENDSSVTGAGQHQFDVNIEGSPFLTNYDLYAQYGWLMPAQETRLLRVTDGMLNIDFLHVSGAEDPVVSGIAINRLQ